MLSSDAALQFTSSSSPQRFQSHRIPCRGQPFRSHRVTAMLFNHFVLIAELLSSGDSASDHLDSRLPHHQAARLLYCWAIKWSHMDDDDWEVTRSPAPTPSSPPSCLGPKCRNYSSWYACSIVHSFS
jgi:hypothetical protein